MCCGWRGNVDRRQHFLRRERGLHRVHQEVVNADHALTARALRHHLRAHRHHHRGMVVGGVGMRQIAANRGEVAHDRVGDDGAGLVCAGVAPPHHVGAFQRALAHHRADDQRAIALFEGVQPGDLAQINDIGRGGQAELHQRDQALAAREDLGLVGMRLERLPDLRQAGGGEVGKLVRYHERPPWRGMRGRGWACDGADGESSLRVFGECALMGEDANTLQISRYETTLWGKPVSAKQRRWGNWRRWSKL